MTLTLYVVLKIHVATFFVARLGSCSKRHMICALFPLAAETSQSFSNGSNYLKHQFISNTCAIHETKKLIPLTANRQNALLYQNVPYLK